MIDIASATPRTPSRQKICRRGSSCLTVIEVEEPTEARATVYLAIGPAVIRRTDVPDELVTDALVKPKEAGFWVSGAASG